MALKDQYSTNLGIGDLPEFDQNKYPGIWADSLRVRNALRVLQTAVDNYTGAFPEDPQYWPNTKPSTLTRVQNISRVYAQAGEAIGLAQVAYFKNVAGVLTAFKANSTDGTLPARAYCSTPSGVAVGLFGEFILLGVNPYYGGLTVGALYYLHTTSGQISSTPPFTGGNIIQPVGYALSATDLWFNPTLSYLTL